MFDPSSRPTRRLSPSSVSLPAASPPVCPGSERGLAAILAVSPAAAAPAAKSQGGDRLAALEEEIRVQWARLRCLMHEHETLVAALDRGQPQNQGEPGPVATVHPFPVWRRTSSR
ncbi:hypothetical protein [Oleisolibacter albus]|uniref:hypothetical protein n=1 Tax=Oleisolibacter albus TaxID=2171757 RepID=UPI0012D7F22B|nr:hypothetical protein [Oleisolibacter albus]